MGKIFDFNHYTVIFFSLWAFEKYTYDSFIEANRGGTKAPLAGGKVKRAESAKSEGRNSV